MVILLNGYIVILLIGYIVILLIGYIVRWLNGYFGERGKSVGPKGKGETFETLKQLSRLINL